MILVLLRCGARMVSLLCLLVFFPLMPPLFASQVENNMDQLIRQSTFIFVGTVQGLNATTMKSVKPSDATAVVRLDKLIEAPGAPPDLAGKSITVQLHQPGALRVGQQATFFTKGWLLGNSMAVIELGHSLEAAGGAIRTGAGGRGSSANDGRKTPEPNVHGRGDRERYRTLCPSGQNRAYRLGARSRLVRG